MDKIGFVKNFLEDKPDLVDTCVDKAACMVKDQLKGCFGGGLDDQGQKKEDGGRVNAEQRSSGDDDQAGLSKDDKSATDQLADLF
ncbi:hypothetical protein GJAV_G00242310 [Gymnothorax javanicus]|nr:hypothetical protein GJAV_G00242310 [Gymnothorax javanicus]